MNVADHTIALGFESSFEICVGFDIATGVIGWLWVVLDGVLSWSRLGLLNQPCAKERDVVHTLDAAELRVERGMMFEDD